MPEALIEVGFSFKQWVSDERRKQIEKTASAVQVKKDSSRSKTHWPRNKSYQQQKKEVERLVKSLGGKGDIVNWEDGGDQ